MIPYLESDIGDIIIEKDGKKYVINVDMEKYNVVEELEPEHFQWFHHFVKERYFND